MDDKIQELKAKGYDPVYIWDAKPNEEDLDHVHPFGTHLVILEGEIEIRMDGKSSVLKPNNETDIPRQIIHYGKAGPNGCKYIVAEWHYEVEMGSKFAEATSAGGVVLNPEGKVLVVDQQGVSWSLPKGHVEAGEDLLKTAKREIYEESGISDLTLIKKLEPYQRFGNSKKLSNHGFALKTIVLFLFKTNQTELKPIDPENPEARWVAKEEVADLLTHPRDKEFFRSIMQELDKTIDL